jgi:hypothetical protein
MNKTYFIFWLIIVTICVTLFSSCKERVTDVTLNKNELFLIQGETVSLIATVYPADASNDKVAWSSSNPNVATVNSNGLVTALADGKTTITVTTKDGKKTAICEVMVDYRAQWTGDCDFEVKRHWWIMDEGGGSDTLNYSGKISIGDANNKLNITYLENATLEVEVDEDGKILKLLNYPSMHYIDGKFNEKSKIHIFLDWGSGQGGGLDYTINGTKKEGGNK